MCGGGLGGWGEASSLGSVHSGPVVLSRTVQAGRGSEWGFPNPSCGDLDSVTPGRSRGACILNNLQVH